MDVNQHIIHQNTTIASQIAIDRLNGIKFACALKKDKFGKKYYVTCSILDLATTYSHDDNLVYFTLPQNGRTFIQAKYQNQFFIKEVTVKTNMPFRDYDDRNKAQSDLIEGLQRALHNGRFDFNLFNWGFLRLIWCQQLENVFNWVNGESDKNFLDLEPNQN